MNDVRRISTTWVLMVILTFGSVAVEQLLGVRWLAAITVLGIAMFKVHLIGMHFMDVRVAPRWLRVVFDGYVLVVLGVLLTLVTF